MVPSKYSGRVLFMTTIALVLVAVSLSTPWYKLSYEGAYNSGEYIFFTDRYSTDRGISEFAGDADDDPVAHLMGLETTLIQIWVLVGLFFVFCVLLDLELWSFLSGGFILAIALLAVFLFVGCMGDAVVDSTYFPQSDSIPHPGGFMDTAATEEGSATCTPMRGFGLLLAAALLQLLAVSYRVRAVIDFVIKDLRTFRTLPSKPATDDGSAGTAPEQGSKP